MKIVECIPNFSEGRRREVINSIANAAKAVPGVTLLDCESDVNHNRMVLTFVGEPEPLKQAALAASAVAVREIDLTIHTGEHPRMGAVDVVPFVPLREVSIQDCITIANEFASEYSRAFNVPVFLYEAAARRPERKDLAYVRSGQFEGLRDLIGVDPAREPDYGPKTIHPTAGATAVGARQILIAYNVNLDSSDVTVARKIARLVRARDGGLPTVKALGFELKDKHLVQVSMNLTDYTTTSILEAYKEVMRRSEELGVSVVESEIVGLVPLGAISDTAASYLRLANFSPNQIIENKLLQLSSLTDRQKTSSDLSVLSISEFIDSVSSSEPAPGGGTVAAYSGALAAALVAMVCKLTIGKKGYEAQSSRVTEILEASTGLTVKLKELANLDTVAFLKVSHALAMPKSSDIEKQQRSEELRRALIESTEVPIDTMKACFEVHTLAKEISNIGNKSARSDAQTAAELSLAAARGAWFNIKINLASIKNEEFERQVRIDLGELLTEIVPSETR